jgi:DNA polymerase-3 subunit delta
MGMHKRTELEGLLAAIARGAPKQIYLCYGERFLCRQVLQRIEQAFLDTGAGSVHILDGSVEDGARLHSRLLSFSLLPGFQLFRVVDTPLFQSKKIGAQIWEKALLAHQEDKGQAARRHLLNLLQLGSVEPDGETIFSDISADQWRSRFGFTHPGLELSWADKLVSGASGTAAPSDDPLDRLVRLFKQGFVKTNILLLSAEHVDKRKKIFQTLKKHGEIVDCSIAEGVSRAALGQQKEVLGEMVRKTLKAMDKAIEPDALELLFERVGFYPVGVVMEAEKLALYVDERPRITKDDVTVMVGRTREDAIFELTEALDGGNLAQAMTVLDHLFSDGVHSLAVIASLRNHQRRLLIFRAIQDLETPPWRQRMSSNEFQNVYLPALKDAEVWPDLLKAHPYALYMGFSKAAQHPLASLKKSLSLLLEAEFKLKGGVVSPRIVLEELLISLTALRQAPAGSGRNLGMNN